MKLMEKCVATTVTAMLRVMLRVYFRNIELFHAERVPRDGPVLFASNHPASVTDAFLIGTTVRRQVHFVATVRMFRSRPLAVLLRQCGIIPINRLKDDPHAMRSVMETFEACFQVMERGGAVGIFPEGITYDDSQLKVIKSGAARMALELEHRHEGRLGLKIVPVGLTYSAKDRYRSDVIVHFGEPVRVGEFLVGYETRRKEAINELTAAIERGLQLLIVHLPRLEQARVVEGVKRLYLERLKLGNRIVVEPMTPRAEELLLTQAIADAVGWAERSVPDRLGALARRLRVYERCRARLRLPCEMPGESEAAGSLLRRAAAWTLLGIVGSPFALYGWAHRLLPAAMVRWVATRMTQAGARKAQTPHASMLSGLVAFGCCYAIYVFIVWLWFGWRVAGWYGLTLPPVGLLAHHYAVGMRRFADGLRTLIVFWRVPFSAGRLKRMHSGLQAEIEALREEYRRSLPAGTVGQTRAP
jgi:1-acyl-sn-glycerol-3-phosphate acyltransferase